MSSNSRRTEIRIETHEITIIRSRSSQVGLDSALAAAERSIDPDRECFVEDSDPKFSSRPRTSSKDRNCPTEAK